jgi:transcriptional regulator with XRE-family HTH domain
MKLIEEVGKRIRLFRNQKGMSLEELGEKIGVSKSFVSKIENGKKPISLERIESISKALDIEVEYLLVDRNRLVHSVDEIGLFQEDYSKEELLKMFNIAQKIIEKDIKRPK